jgi:hypothetical protein
MWTQKQTIPVLFIAIGIFISICCGFYALFYKLDEIRYGDSKFISMVDHIFIFLKVLVTVTAVSQLWLSDNTDYVILLFFGGVVVFLNCFRRAFRILKDQDVGFYVSILLTLLFGLASSLGVIYGIIHILNGEATEGSFFLYRSIVFGLIFFACSLVAIRFHFRRANRLEEELPTHFLPPPDVITLV